MTYLLDTHYILWSLFVPGRIPERALEIFQDSKAMKIVSGVNLWEISLKYSLGKLTFEGTNPDHVYEKIVEAGYGIVAIDNCDLLTYYMLPKKDDHKDPFDRLLIWQAIQKGYTVLTADRKFSHYTEDGLKVVVVS